MIDSFNCHLSARAWHKFREPTINNLGLRNDAPNQLELTFEIVALYGARRLRTRPAARSDSRHAVIVSALLVQCFSARSTQLLLFSTSSSSVSYLASSSVPNTSARARGRLLAVDSTLLSRSLPKKDGSYDALASASIPEVGA